MKIMARLSSILIFFLLLIAGSLNAQEICDNGIDDDGDNLVDVFDPDCPCDDQILLCQPSCEFVSPGGALNFDSQWESSETIPVYQSPVVGDIDNDGSPEVMFMSADSLVSSDPRRAKNILIINGSTGETELKLFTPFMAWVGPTPFAMADIDNDGFGEIIVAAMNHSSNTASDRGRLFCYEHTGALKWVSDSIFGNPLTARFGSSVGIADFNNDGLPEVYLYNKIFNAQTGALLAQGLQTDGLGMMTNQAFGDLSNVVAANLTSSPGLELAAGNTVYNISITNTAGIAGNSMTPIKIAGKNDGFTSLADIDLDGNLDLVVATSGNTAELYVWNPNNGSPIEIATINLPNTGGSWTGVPFIGDMDKDCQPEIGITRARRVYALDYDGSTSLSTKWTLITSDGSGFTGITMFDFNQDGTQELVYRDESNLRIIDGSGSSPVTIGTSPCSSGTGADMAVVADVDGDGQAEICVSCATEGIQLGKIRVFESSGQPWAPCRNIWNQYGYFNVNINNNLTIPIQQQQHQVLLSTITCPFYTCNENRPFNTFLSQATFLTQEGCPIYPASDVALSLASSSCNGSAAYDISLTITNVGGAPSDSGYPIRFYDGNPFNTAAQLIPVISGPNATSGVLNPDESETINFQLDISSPEKPFSLFVILNDNGNAATPFSFPLSLLPECNYADNVISLANIDCCPFGDLTITSLEPPSAEFCEGQNSLFTVSASSAAGLNNAIYTWTFPDNSEIQNDSVLVSETGTYTVNIKDDAQCSVEQTVEVNSVPFPTEAAAGKDQEVCEETSSLEGNIPSVGTGEWSVITGGASIDNPVSPTSLVSDLGIGTNEFVWTISNGAVCTSSDTVIITRIQAPDSSLAGDDQQVCSDEATLNANIPVVGTGEWVLVSGQADFTDETSPTTTVTNLGEGQNVFRWAISNGICDPLIDDVIIERFIPPAGAFAGDDQQLCVNETTLDGQGSGAWISVNAGPVFDNLNDPQTAVSNLSIGNNELVWTVTNGTCPPVSDTVVVFVDENPSQAVVGENLQVCAETSTLDAESPLVGTGVWSVASGGASIDDENSINSGVSGLSIGLNSFVWTVTNGVCPPTSAIFDTQRDENPSSAIAGSDIDTCGSSTLLAANIPTVGTGSWSVVSGSGDFDDLNSASALVSNLSAGENIFEWTVSNGVCPSSSDQVSVNSSETPFPVDAGEDQSICEETTTLSAAQPTLGTGVWSIISGSANIQDVNSANSALTNIEIGEVVLRWTVSNGTCEEFDEVTILRSDFPSDALAGEDQEICGNATLLEGNTPLVGTGTWTVIQGAADFTDSSNPTDAINNIQVGENLLVWEISNGTCPSNSDTVTIVVNEDPLEAEAGENQSICQDFSQLNATPASIGTGSWQIVSGSADIADSNNPNTNLTNIDFGIVTLQWTVNNGACEVSDIVTISRSEEPDAAIAGEDQEACEGIEVQLNANAPTIGQGVWSSSSSEIQFSDSLSNTALVSSDPAGDYVLVWTISNGSCAPSLDSLILTINENNAVANVGDDIEICSDSVTVSAANPISGTGIWTILSGDGLIQNADSLSTLITGLTPGQTTLVWTVENGACPPVSDELVITINEIVLPPNAGEDQQVCSEQTTLDASAVSSGSGLWSVVTGSAIFTEPSNPQTEVSGLAIGVNVLQFTITNGTCPPQSDQVIIIRDSVPFPANAGEDLQACENEELTLNANEPSPGTGNWEIISGSGSLSDETNPFSTFTPSEYGQIFLSWTVLTGDCPATSDTLLIENVESPSAALAGADSTLCSSNYFLNAETPLIGAGTWSTNGSGVFANAGDENTDVSMLSKGENEIIWTVSNGSCPASSDTIILTVTKKPISPNAGPDISICEDVAILSAAQPSVGTGLWSIVSGNIIIDDSTSPNTSVSGVEVGETVLRWTVSNDDCEAFDELTILRSEPPSIAVAGDNLTVCSESIQLNADAPLVGTGLWSVLSGAGTFENPSSETTLVSDLASGTSAFQWTVSSGACKPSSAVVEITRDTSILPANAGDDFETCSDTTTLNANPAFGGFWTVVDGSAIIEDENDANSFVSGLEIGSATLSWTIPANGSCPETSDEVIITRLAPPSDASAGEDMMVCDDSVELSANVPSVGTGEWLVVGGNATLDSPSDATTLAQGLEPGNNVFEWRISNGVCPPATDQITIARGDTAYAGEDITLCDSSATLDAFLPKGLTGFWQVQSGNGVFADSSDAQTSVDSLLEGENIFVWTVLGGFCPDSSDIVIVTRSCNTPPIITNDEFTINEDSTLEASIITDDIDPDGTPLTADTNLVQEPSNGEVTVQPDGGFIYIPDENFFGLDTFIVAICDSGFPLPILCGNDTVIINVLPVNDPPIIVNDTVAGLSGAEITGNLNDNNSDVDSDLIADTNPVSGPNGGTIVIQPDGSYVYTPDEGFTGTDTVVVLICEDPEIPDVECYPDTLFITIDESTLTADAGPDQELCGDVATLNANDPNPNSGVWSIISGSAIIVNEDGSTTLVTNLSEGENEFVWTVSSGSQSVSDTVVITSNPLAAFAFAGEDQVVCGDEATLTGSSPGDGNGLWTSFTGGGVITNPDQETVLVQNLSAGPNLFVYTITLGDCISSDTVSVNSIPTAIIDLGNDTSICPQNNVLEINGISNFGEGSWSVVSGSADFSNAQSVVTTVTNLQAGANTLVFIAGISPCEASDTLLISLLEDSDILCGEIFIPEGFSPNGDLSNDVFVIYGVDGKRIDIKVFNRWGNLVYESDSYQNNWDGVCNTGGVLFGENLPEGTYYYLVQIDGEAESRKGYLTLWR